MPAILARKHRQDGYAAAFAAVQEQWQGQHEIEEFVGFSGTAGWVKAPGGRWPADCGELDSTMDSYNPSSLKPDAAPEALLEELAWLKQVARALLGRPEDAEDLVQEVMVEAVRQRSRTGGLARPRLRTWLRTVAQRKAWRRLERTGSRRQAEDLAGEGDAGPHSAPDETLERLELHRDLTHEIEQLDSEDRQLIVQRYLQGLAPVEIAAQLGLTSSIVRKRLARALERLRARLRSTPRGDSWMGALAFLANEAPRPAAPLLAASTGAFATLPWIMAKLTIAAGLIAISASALWFARAEVLPDPAMGRSLIASQESEPNAAEGEDLRADAGVSLDRASTRVSDGSRASLAPVPDGAPEPIRAMRADGAPVPGALGLLVPEEGDPEPFVFDEKGEAVLSLEDRGSVYATAPGFSNARIDLAEDPSVRSLVLHAAQVVKGVITVEGLPPGETLRFKRFIGNREAGIPADQPAVRKVLQEGGFVPEDVRVATLESGAFQLELSWLLGTKELSEMTFACPPAFLVKAVNGVSVSGDRTEIAFRPGPGEVHIDLERLPGVRGRLRWKDTSEPVLGGIVHQRLNADGTSMDGIPYLELDEEGGFLVPAVGRPRNGNFEPGPLAATLVLHVQDPSEASGTQFRFSLAGQELPWNLGDLEVERIQPLPVLVRGRRADGSFQPLEAGLISSDAEARTGKDGMGTILFRPGQTLEVLSAGWHYRQVLVAPGVYTEEAPFEIDLEPAPLLSLVGCEELRAAGVSALPTVRIAFDWTPFETAELDAEDKGSAYGHRVHNVHAKFGGGGTGGALWSFSDPGAPGHVEFRLPRGDRLEIPGLLESRPFAVQVVDPLGQLLLSEEVTLSDSRTVDLAPASHQLASLVCQIQWEDRTPVGGGQVLLSGSAGRSIGLPFEDGVLRVAPLAAGSLALEVKASDAEGFHGEVHLEAAQERTLTITLRRAD